MTITMTQPCSYVVLKASLGVLVPCTIDRYVDISKVSEDFKVVEMAVPSESGGLEAGRRVGRGGPMCALDVRQDFVFERVSPQYLPSRHASTRMQNAR